mgnify:FL=1
MVGIRLIRRPMSVELRVAFRFKKTGVIDSFGVRSGKSLIRSGFVFVNGVSDSMPSGKGMMIDLDL